MSSILDLPPASSVTAVVEELQGALDSVAAVVVVGGLEHLSGPELLEITARLHALASQSQALAVTASAKVRADEAALGCGFSSTSRWLEVDGRMSKGESRAALALGEKLAQEFTATRDAWLAGEVSAGAVREITTLIPKRLKGLPGDAYVAERDRLEALAVHAARTGTVPAVRRAIERAALVADRAGADAAALAAKESEFLSFTPVADGVEVRGFLATETAAVVLTAFDQCHDARYRNGTLATDDRDDTDRETLDRVARTAGARRQRREHHNAEILAELVTHLLGDGELGNKHSQRPHLMVTVHSDDYAAGLGGEVLLTGFGSVPVPNTTIDRLLCDAEVHPVLTRRPGAPPGPTPPTRARANAPDPAAALSGFPGSVHGSNDPPWRPPMRPRDDRRGGWEHVGEFGTDPSPEEIAADTDVASMVEFSDDLDDHVSWWNRFLGEPARHVLDVGRSYRTAPPKIRHALTIRDGGCAAPGCDSDASRCEAHHITYWEHGGETSISNMVLLCSRHHHMVHEGRWQILRDDHLDPGDPGYVTLVPSTPCVR